MKKRILSITISMIILVSFFNIKVKAEVSKVVKMKQDILTLMLAYPEYIVGVEKSPDGLIYMVMKSGKKIVYDDGRQKTIEQKLDNPDLQDSMEQIYPLGVVTSLMEKDFDPGRIRVYSLLNEVYGGSRAVIEKNLKSVNAGYSNFQFNGNNAAAASLKAAMKEIANIPNNKGNIFGTLFPVNGTYNYRVIQGTGRLSPHAYAIAIDLKSDPRDYWKWTSKEKGEKRLLSYPIAAVEIMEKYNFTWGGKWSHFDILHFEYRPEILLEAKYFGKQNGDNKEWYTGAPIEEAGVKEKIEKIDALFKS